MSDSDRELDYGVSDDDEEPEKTGNNHGKGRSRTLPMRFVEDPKQRAQLVRSCCQRIRVMMARLHAWADIRMATVRWGKPGKWGTVSNVRTMFGDGIAKEPEPSVMGLLRTVAELVERSYGEHGPDMDAEITDLQLRLDELRRRKAAAEFRAGARAKGRLAKVRAIRDRNEARNMRLGVEIAVDRMYEEDDEKRRADYNAKRDTSIDDMFKPDLADEVRLEGDGEGIGDNGKVPGDGGVSFADALDDSRRRTKAKKAMRKKPGPSAMKKRTEAQLSRDAGEGASDNWRPSTPREPLPPANPDSESQIRPDDSISGHILPPSPPPIVRPPPATARFVSHKARASGPLNPGRRPPELVKAARDALVDI